MDERLLSVYLYDFYGELLNDNQRSVYDDFIMKDLSLSEIAQDRGISRQGVHDMIRRCRKMLESYEEKLHLVDRFLLIKSQITQINELTRSDATDATLDKIRELSNLILEEL